jgi:hypothetical protein
LEPSNAILKTCLFALDIENVVYLMTGIVQALRVVNIGKGVKQG